VHMESDIYVIVAQELRKKSITYRFDISADLHIEGVNNAKLFGAIKRRYLHERGYPDLFIAHRARGFGGMFIEIKKDDKLKNDKHTKEQKEYHQRLNEQGYYVCFGMGLEDTLRKISWYLETE